jgi:predicted CxxxxCH...CXXCH cytochrome family protein
MSARFRWSVATVSLVAGVACGNGKAFRHATDAGGDHPVVNDAWVEGNSDVPGGSGTVDGGVASATCVTCHGGAVNAAPPSDPSGNTSTSSAGVGAHQQHLGASSWHAEIACTECHVVPSKAGYDPAVPTHLNGKDDLRWGALAGEGTFDGATLTCAGVYCHGSTLPGANAGGTVNRAPIWNQVDGRWSACGTTCHTNPPGGTHPSSTACETCHGDVVASFMAGDVPVVLWKNPALHINGKVDLATGGSLSCTSCHGDPGTGPAPPKGTKGETATTQAAVGAHAQHLATSTWHRAGQCLDCHTLPSSTNHTNGQVDFAWGTPSNAGGASPAFSATDNTCANTYCHGSTLPDAVAGGTVNRTPVWTQVNGTWDACGTTCHTNPPGGSHPNSTACQTCHSAVVSSFTAGNPPVVTWKDPALHINGKVDLAAGSSLTCTTCHGDPAVGPAPPKGSKGETLTSQPAVGAHAQHLATSTWHRSGQCADCHATPTSTSHSNGQVDFSWGAPSNAGGASPAFSGTSNACANTYCHGTTLLGAVSGGAVNRTPVWTQVDGTWDACGTTCHTNPPGGTHPNSTACQTCHSAVLTAFVAGNPPTVTWKDPSLHINGTVDLAGGTSLDCTSCHGDPALGPAPPKGTNGETLTSQPAVGAHAKHLAASTWHRGGQCADCHATPTSTSHSNGQVDFSWGTPSNADGANAIFNSANNTCANTYCHGTTLLGAVTGGSVNRTPVWTQVDGTFSVCGTTCHTNPPGGTHPAASTCDTCHSAVVASYAGGNPPVVTWKDPSLHINGKVDLSGGSGLDCTSCHGDPAVGPAPPKGTNGETLSSQAAVGAHAQHLAASTWHRAGECVDCHAVPTSTSHSNGQVDFSWGTPSNAGGATPAYAASTTTCAGVYCHGTTLAGAVSGGSVNRTPVWTQVNGTWDACGSTCHTTPPGGDHVNATACANCHSMVIASFSAGNPPAATWADASLHVNGKVELIDGTSVTCTSCHGSAAVGPAPPRGVSGESATNTLAVGRHSAHLTASATHTAIPCETCHVIPAVGDTSHTADYVASSALDSPGHHGDVTLSGAAAGMTWNVNATQGTPVTARGTCAGACHSDGRGGAPVVAAYWAGGSWTAGNCGNCHRATPTSGRHSAHTQEGSCTMCHPGANTTTHVNGAVDTLATATGPQGGSVTITHPTSGTCANRASCTGTCHGVNHSSRCW